MHSVACRKRGDSCRFHYPKPTSDRTLLSKPDEGSGRVPSVSGHNSKLILSFKKCTKYSHQTLITLLISHCLKFGALLKLFKQPTTKLYSFPSLVFQWFVDDKQTLLMSTVTTNTLSKFGKPI